MTPTPSKLVVVALLVLGIAAHVRSTQAATWTFGGNANGLSGLAAKTLSVMDGVGLQISVHHPAGGRFVEDDSAGLSIDSNGSPGIVDSNGPDKLNLLTVGGVPAASVETIRFSFDTNGLLTGINFDGVKDESLEYFILTSSGGTRINFFDSFANTTIAGAVDSAILAGEIIGPIVYLLEINSAIDDEAQGLHIPFAAGEQFVLNYAELGAAFHTTEAGNGARFQGLTVVAIPEPSPIALFIVAACLGIAAIRIRPDVASRSA
jgi:hypothetical protein